jgi:hypothetical protein
MYLGIEKKEVRIKTIVATVICIILTSQVYAMGGGIPQKENKTIEYWIDKGTKVLAFSETGNPIRYVIFENQKISLFHTRSGGGQYAFKLMGISVVGYQGMRQIVIDDGYFLCSKRKIRKTEFKKKTSMKYKTKKGTFHAK